jgi:hypothetical protein
MKKLVLAILSFVFALSMIACGSPEPISTPEEPMVVNTPEPSQPELTGREKAAFDYAASIIAGLDIPATLVGFLETTVNDENLETNGQNVTVIWLEADGEQAAILSFSGGKVQDISYIANAIVEADKKATTEEGGEYIQSALGDYPFDQWDREHPDEPNSITLDFTANAWNEYSPYISYLVSSRTGFDVDAVNAALASR